MAEVIHVWETKDPKKLKHKIREHADGHFTVISYTTFWRRRATYGDFNSLEEAKKFLLAYKNVPLDAWTQLN